MKILFLDESGDHNLSIIDPHYGSRLPRIAEAVSILGKRLVIGLETV
jgi:hypothetical protein